MSVCSYFRGSAAVSAEQLAALWTGAGGRESATVPAVAIALAEAPAQQGYAYADAVSPACAYGLWQILDIHASELSVSVESLLIPSVNAGFAVVLSNNGQNWAPWDTAYTSLERAAQRYPLTYPEAGSPAYNNIPLVNALLSNGGGGGYVQIPPGGSGEQGPGGGPAAPGVPYAQVSPPGGEAPPPQGGSGGYQPIPQITVPYALGSGWDNLRQYWGQDQAGLYNFYQTLAQMVANGGQYTYRG